MDLRNLLVTFFIILKEGALVQCYSTSDADSLYTALTSSYKPQVRPAEPITMNVDFTLKAINILDVKTQVFSVTGWFTLIWQDTRLQWTPSSYGNIQYMFLTEDYIWKPAVTVDNQIDDITMLGQDNLPFRIDYSGNVFWQPPGIFDVHCDVDITYYPFDKQDCHLSFTTWSYDLVNIVLIFGQNSIVMTYFEENGEWDVVSTSTSTGTAAPPGQSFSFSELYFYFTLKRKTTYYDINIVVPAIVTIFLGTFVFILPCESGEKVGFSLTVLLALAVLLTLIASLIPTTSKSTSLLGLFLAVTFVMNAFETLLVVTVLKTHHNADKERQMSRREQRIARFLSKFTFYKTVSEVKNEKDGEAAKQVEVKRNSVAAQSPAWDGNGVIVVEYTWAEFAEIIDRVLFIVALVSKSIVTLIFMLLLTLGA